MRTIYVLGSLNADLAITTDKFPVEGETVNGSGFKVGCGGKGLNQAIAAAKLGGKVKFCGKIGKDSFGKEMKNWLKINKVNTWHVKTVNDTASGVAEIILNNNNNRIVLDLGANLKISIKDIDAFLLRARKGDIFVTQLENNISAIAYALKVAKEKGMITVLNPAPANVEIKQALNFVDYLIPNETEYEILKDYISKDTNLIVTKGENGYEYISKRACFSEIAPKVKVVDTTGAGDCFVGAFAYMLASGKPVDKGTLDLVTKIASISTTRFGSSISSPTMEEVDKF
ncbi:MAG: ribokinase [Bacilli bacterium]|nr:ribokinase [Bacilli bacterium]